MLFLKRETGFLLLAIRQISWNEMEISTSSDAHCTSDVNTSSCELELNQNFSELYSKNLIFVDSFALYNCWFE